MNMRRFALEAAALIAAAVLCALLSNALAARERKLSLVGYYPNAQKVPAQATETAAVTATVVTPPATMSTTTTSTAPPTTTIIVPTQTTTTLPPKTTTARPTSVPAPVPAPVPGSSSPVAPKPADTTRFSPHADKPYVEIGYNDVAALHAAGALFLDARRTSVYEQGHIAGARPYSVWESDIDEKVNKLFAERGDERQQAQPIVVYCSGGECEDSHMLAQKLWGIQFNNVYVYKDGFPDWQKHGAAVHTGSNP
jgi:rhodanese-related sulfurtransferase